VFKQERTREYLKLEEDLENQIVEARKISVQARIQEELKRLKEQVSTYVRIIKKYREKKFQAVQLPNKLFLTPLLDQSCKTGFYICTTRLSQSCQ
jgi:hypothetical protein